MKTFFRIGYLLLAVLCLALPLLLPQRAAGEEMSEPLVDTNAAGADRVTRFLVLGLDRAAKLTDSIFLVSLNETQKEARILQIPRDTYANYTDKDYKKLNGALNALGERGVKQMLSDALGVRIDYFFILDLSCLTRLVNAVGGVDVVIPQDMRYTDPAQGLEICLPAGPNHLDGNGAEQFVRFRSGYVNADLGRLDAQKIFLKAFAKKCQTLSSSQFLQLTCSALTGVQTDIGLPDALRVASVLRECNTDTIPMATIAGEAVQGSSGAWYYCINRAGACRMVNEYLFPDSPLTQESFDSSQLFHRTDHEDFHSIYIAPDKG